MKSNVLGSMDLRGSSSNKNGEREDVEPAAVEEEIEEEEGLIKSGNAAGGRSCGGVVKRL